MENRVIVLDGEEVPFESLDLEMQEMVLVGDYYKSQLGKDIQQDSKNMPMLELNPEYNDLNEKMARIVESLQHLDFYKRREIILAFHAEYSEMIEHARICHRSILKHQAQEHETR